MKAASKRKMAGTFGIDELEKLNSRTLHAVLATADIDNPDTSLVAYAFDCREKVLVFLTPRSTTKYSNILHNHNVSLLIDARKTNDSDNYLSGEAYTIFQEVYLYK